MNNPDHIPYDDSDLFDTNDAIIDLMSEGYSREEATRMVGEYDPDEYYEHDDDIPEMEDFDASDFVDGADFE